MSKRRLSLRRETLTELQQPELGSVVGAASLPYFGCTQPSVIHSACQTCGIACTYDCHETS